MIKVYKNYFDFKEKTKLTSLDFFTVLEHYQRIFILNEYGLIVIRQYADGLWGTKVHD